MSSTVYLVMKGETEAWGYELKPYAVFTSAEDAKREAASVGYGEVIPVELDPVRRLFKTEDK